MRTRPPQEIQGQRLVEETSLKLGKIVTCRRLQSSVKSPGILVTSGGMMKNRSDQLFRMRGVWRSQMTTDGERPVEGLESNH